MATRHSSQIKVIGAGLAFVCVGSVLAPAPTFAMTPPQPQVQSEQDVPPPSPAIKAAFMQLDSDLASMPDSKKAVGVHIEDEVLRKQYAAHRRVAAASENPSEGNGISHANRGVADVVANVYRPGVRGPWVIRTGNGKDWGWAKVMAKHKLYNLPLVSAAIKCAPYVEKKHPSYAFQGSIYEYRLKQPPRWLFDLRTVHNQGPSTAHKGIDPIGLITSYCPGYNPVCPATVNRAVPFCF